MCKKKYIFVVFAFLIVTCFILLNFKIEIISGQSMAPTLSSGQVTIVNKNVDKYQENDIVVFNTETYGVCVKRIVGVEGDTIKITNNKVFKNNIEIPSYENIGYEDAEYTLKNNEYFVVGDNSRASIDSRNYGVICYDDIIGKVIYY